MKFSVIVTKGIKFLGPGDLVFWEWPNAKGDSDDVSEALNWELPFGLRNGKRFRAGYGMLPEWKDGYIRSKALRPKRFWIAINGVVRLYVFAKINQWVSAAESGVLK
ncbi:MAG: hypothetical protein ABSB35_35630 [Bryobacteraceae bacterium]|jgi:hypothetical protein